MRSVNTLLGALALILGTPHVAADHLTPLNEVANASCADGANLDGNRSYQVLLPAKDDTGRQISFQVLEPARFDCANAHKGAHPLLLHGPGFSGTRSTSGFDNYRAAGYTVISWDPRGFGDTTGSVRVMDPQFEGQYYVQILDWAEQSLDYLAWHNLNPEGAPLPPRAAATAHEKAKAKKARKQASRKPVPRPQNGESDPAGVNLLVGAMGSSYGGGYQMMLLTVDGRKRLDAIIPNITWHDLRNALNPGDGVKTLWDMALSAAGSASGYTSGDSIEGLDPFIEETLARGASMNEWPRQSLDWFHYRGLGYWCAANGLPAMPYPRYGADNIPMFDTSGSYNVPPRAGDGRPGLGDYLQPVSAQAPAEHFDQLDVLITQGMIDTLFDYNEAWWNYQCLQAAGAHVSLYTHNGGHVLPYAQSPDAPVSDTGACPVDSLAWFEAKLRGGPAVETADTCFALGTEGDFVMLDGKDVIAPRASQDYTVRTLQGPLPAPAGVAVPNGVVGIANISGNASVPAVLGTIGAGGAILAGLPRLTVDVRSGHGGNEQLRDGAGAGDCAMQSVPLRTGCDSILFVGIGRKGAGMPNHVLIDDQLTPLRGLGRHEVDLVGIAERLQPGDELAVVFFAEHPQFFSAMSRDVTLPGVVVTGEVGLPLFAVDADGKPVPGADADTLLQ